MGVPKSFELPCDVCHKVVAGGLRTWKRRLPSHDSIAVCAACSYRLTRSADGRGIDSEDMMHMVSVYRTLAGEIWSDLDRIYWFKVPFVHLASGRMPDLLDRERLDASRLSETTKKELARAGVQLA